MDSKTVDSPESDFSDLLLKDGTAVSLNLPITDIQKLHFYPKLADKDRAVSRKSAVLTGCCCCQLSGGLQHRNSASESGNTFVKQARSLTRPTANLSSSRKSFQHQPTISSHTFYSNMTTPDDPSAIKSTWCEIPSLKMQKSKSLSVRVSSLFAFGVFLALLGNFLQKQRNITIFSPGLFGDVLNSAWWIPPTFGLASIAVGLLYPVVDKMLGKQKHLMLDWSDVMRCIAIFVGINHAIAKINFESNVHLSVILAAVSCWLWYYFDQSLLGLGFGLLITGVATLITQLLVALDVFGYANPDFLYMTSWVPWLYFSGGITVGTVGRALAGVNISKEHSE